MRKTIQVAMLDDHQSVIDGYTYRLSQDERIEVIAFAFYGEALEPMLAENPVDVLLLDVSVPTSAKNDNPYPILHLIPRIIQSYPQLAVLVISMHDQRSLIKAVLETGISGYILKDDRAVLQDLAAAVRSVAQGGICFSRPIHDMLRQNQESGPELSPRQTEILSLLAAYPNLTTADAAEKLAIANSTVRNLLSRAYLTLDVRNRTAAIARARQLGLLAPL